MGVFAILVNTAVITHIGRRRVFLVIGMFICGLTQLLTAVVYTIQPGTVSTGRAIVGLSVVYIVGYNVRANPTQSAKPTSLFHQTSSSPPLPLSPSLLLT